MRKLQFKLLILVLLGLVSSTLQAQSGPRQGQHPPGPPPEAISACEGKAAGDEVSFAGRGGETLAAICQARGGQLVAMPLDAPKRPRN